MHTLCSWIEGLTQMMTRKTKVIIKHNERYLRLRREGRNQLMVSQEQMPFMFLVMLHPLPEMKDLKQQKTEVTIHHAAKKEWIWWAEKGGINKLCIVSQHVTSICQDDQLLRLQLRNDWSPFSDSIAPFRFGGWPTINGCGQKKSVSAAYQHLWINLQLLEKLTHMCFFYQDNGRQTVFVSYKQQCWSPSFNLQQTHSSTDSSTEICISYFLNLW